MPDERTLETASATSEFRVDYEKVKRAVRLTERLNRLIPPFSADLGLNITVGRNVFINQGCTFSDIGGIEIGDEVMFGPKVNIISSGHPVDPAERRKGITAAPVTIERNVWIGAGATVLEGVTVGADAVIAAGAVVTGDVPSGTLVAGVPARVVKKI